ncbi:MAG TPA: hypothetical protein VJ201_06530 [Candidatus Babeliales bacterium]|nr:hypothetical protein [Candidatus Babeliales bacterium]HLC06684.1 hypothetical protein [Candidatus Babeliales bacterium]
MKSIKMMIVTTFVLASVVGFCSSVQAVENFELYNKSAKPIKVVMKFGDDEQPMFVIPAGLAGRRNVPNDKPTFLMIQEEGMAGQAIFKRIEPRENTKYLTFEPTKRPTVYPQTGTYMGLGGTTSTGLSLKNNIDKSYIIDGGMGQFRK